MIVNNTVKKDSSNTKNAVPRLGGYHYEFQVGVLRLLDLIEGKADKIKFESARDSQDYFDDIKVFQNDSIHHYQVKWGLTRKAVCLGDFVNPSGSLYLVNLYIILAFHLPYLALIKNGYNLLWYDSILYL